MIKWKATTEHFVVEMMILSVLACLAVISLTCTFFSLAQAWSFSKYLICALIFQEKEFHNILATKISRSVLNDAEKAKVTWSAAPETSFTTHATTHSHTFSRPSASTFSRDKSDSFRCLKADAVTLKTALKQVLLCFGLWYTTTSQQRQLCYWISDLVSSNRADIFHLWARFEILAFV